MIVERLDHLNIITPRFDETLSFYKRVLGMRVGPSPIGDIGAFIYDGSGIASIHVARLTPESIDHLLTANLAHRSREETDPADDFAALIGSAAIDHIGLSCTGFVETITHLETEEVPFRYFHVESQNLHQIFIRDPNGIIIELRFFEAAPAELISRINRGSIAMSTAGDH
jgi:catechol 2,3-dioxygenase-like lactoylglutathione lyase family enzyme